MRARLIGVPLLALAVSVGCGSSDSDSGSDSAAGDGDRRRSGEERAETSTTTAPTTTTTAPPPSTMPVPADGTDVQACVDGACEIAVSGPTQLTFDSRFGIASASIDAVDANGVDFTFVAPDGTVGQISDQVSYPGGGGSTFNTLNLQVLGFDGSTAVVRFSPSAPG